MSNVIPFPRSKGVPPPAPPSAPEPGVVQFVAEPSAESQIADELLRLAELNHEMKTLLKIVLKRTKLR